MDCSPPGCSVHGILQARILEWVAVPFLQIPPVARLVKNPPVLLETWVRSLGWEDSPVESKGYLVQYSVLDSPVDCIMHGAATGLSDFHCISLLQIHIVEAQFIIPEWWLTHTQNNARYQTSLTLNPTPSPTIRITTTNDVGLFFPSFLRGKDCSRVQNAYRLISKLYLKAPCHWR